MKYSSSSGQSTFLISLVIWGPSGFFTEDLCWGSGFLACRSKQAESVLQSSNDQGSMIMMIVVVVVIIFGYSLLEESEAGTTISTVRLLLGMSYDSQFFLNPWLTVARARTLNSQTFKPNSQCRSFSPQRPFLACPVVFCP